MVLAIPRKKARWVRIFSKLFAIPEEKKIYLDDIGGWVWQRCDGRVSVGKMIEDLAGEFKINSKEAEVSLLSYLKNLAQKRLIGFVVEN